MTAMRPPLPTTHAPCAGKTLLALGYGYTAAHLGRALIAQGWRVLGTARRQDTRAAIAAAGATPVPWPCDMVRALQGVSHLLVSAPPGAEGNPILHHARGAIVGAARHLAWVGYLSTTGVYGDKAGDWVDETTPAQPTSARGKRRLQAERDWLHLREVPVHIFRLAGIYGPGRAPFARIRAGTARRIIKEGQVFSRIHIADIVQVLEASMARPRPGRIYNLCDDTPAPPQDVLAYAAALMGVPPPPAVAFEAAQMSPMARAFYADSKRVRNQRIKAELGVVLRYPSYQSALKALWEQEQQDISADRGGSEAQGEN